MLDVYNTNHHIQKMTDDYFDQCCRKHHIIIDEYDLRIILKIIKNNPYCFMNEEYYPILFHEMAKKTSIETVNKIKPMILEKHLLELLM